MEMKSRDMNRVFVEVIERLGGEVVKCPIRKGGSDYFLYAFVGGVKFEWWDNRSRIVLGFGNSVEDREKIFEEVGELVGEISVLKSRKKLKQYISFYMLEGVSEECLENVLSEVYVYLVKNSEEWEKVVGESVVSEEECGVSFCGTVFENLKERGATMSPMFGSMVCEASGMRLERMLCEYYIEGGRIDGVEVGEGREVVSIYECGSGIHRGSYLDWEHWNKVLCRYLYSREVYSESLKRVVILAGGYSREMLLMYENVRDLLGRSGIEFILLRTVRDDSGIGVIRV